MGYWFPLDSHVTEIGPNAKTQDGWGWMRTGEPTSLYNFSYEAITDPDQPPPDWKEPEPPKDQTEVYSPTLDIDTSHTWPGHLTGDVPGSGGDKDAGAMPSAPPLQNKFTVNPSDLRAAEDRLLGKVKETEAAYDSLRAHVESNKNWVFQRSDPTDAGSAGGRGENVPNKLRRTETKDGVEMTDAQSRLLMSCADVVAWAGKMVEAFNKAGNIYVHADKQSYLPDN